MATTITIEQLAERLGGNLWVKGDLKRIYLDRGHNTKKMSTKCYVFQSDNGTFAVSVYIECPSQHPSWIESQRQEVKDGIWQEIEEALANTYYVVVDDATNEYIDTDGKPQPLNYIYSSDRFLSQDAAEKFIAKELGKGYSVKAIDRAEFEKQVAELQEIENNLTITQKLQRGDQISFHNGNPVEKLLEELKVSGFDIKTLTGYIYSDNSGSFKIAKENEKSIVEILEERQARNAEIKNENVIVNTDTPNYGVGTKVKHFKFGEGIVIAESDQVLDVNFPSVGDKKLLKAFVKLEKL